MKKVVEQERWLMRLVIGVPGFPPWIVYETSHLNLVIQAETEDGARNIADKQDGQDEILGIKHPWLSKGHSTCERM